MTPVHFCFVKKKFFSECKADLSTTKFSTFQLFRIRKCTNENKNSADCCAFFVDVNGRVYTNFIDFKLNNKYPAGIIVGPKNGIYSGSEDEEGNVKAN